MMPALQSKSVLYLDFNQDNTCLACGTEKGFKIFFTSPFQELISRDLNGGVGKIRMLNISSLLFLSGDGKKPICEPNKLLIWDDSKVSVIGEAVFPSEIKDFKITDNRIIVALENSIFRYKLPNFEYIDSLETFANPLGIFALNKDVNNMVMAFPTKYVGQITSFFENNNNKKLVVKIHNSPITALELNNKGNKLAAVCEKSNVIKIFDSQNGLIIQELKKSAEINIIYSICFDNFGFWISCLDGLGVINIYPSKRTEEEKISEEDKENEIILPKRRFSFIKTVFQIKDTDKPYAYHKMNEGKNIIVFAKDINALMIASFDGDFYNLVIDTKNAGECKKMNYYKFKTE